MIFSEWYGAYYHVVSEVLAEALKREIDESELRKIIEKYAFGESALAILPVFREERWQLLKEDGSTPIKRKPELPLTDLQKRWLKAIAMDPRIALFGENQLDFPDVEPLFRPEEVLVFDRYGDGDPYAKEAYRMNFRLILDALRRKYPLYIETKNRRGELLGRIVFPETLEYSEKDDKFRLIGKGSRFGNTINLGRIISCRPAERAEAWECTQTNPPRPRSVIFEVTDRRDALERVLLHFAHFKKEAEKIGEGSYRVTVYYDKEDENEIVIRILSFGPMVKVTAPNHFIELIKQRLLAQKGCGL